MTEEVLGNFKISNRFCALGERVILSLSVLKGTSTLYSDWQFALFWSISSIWDEIYANNLWYKIVKMNNYVILITFNIFIISQISCRSCKQAWLFNRWWHATILHNNEQIYLSKTNLEYLIISKLDYKCYKCSEIYS